MKPVTHGGDIVCVPGDRAVGEWKAGVDHGNGPSWTTRRLWSPWWDRYLGAPSGDDKSDVETAARALGWTEDDISLSLRAMDRPGEWLHEGNRRALWDGTTLTVTDEGGA